MIFVCTGSQKFQFNRLLKEIDKLIEEGKIVDEVFAQIGYSTYKPINFSYIDFLDSDLFMEKIYESEIVISHGGTGSLISAIMNERKVIGIPRLSSFGEHVDDHQVQIIDEFSKLNFIHPVYDIDGLNLALIDVRKENFERYESKNMEIICSIIEFIQEGK